MTKKTFIEEQQEVRGILSAPKSTGERSGHDTEIFVNPVTGEKWERYLFELDDDHGEGIGLRRFPYPPISEASEIAINTEL